MAADPASVFIDFEDLPAAYATPILNPDGSIFGYQLNDCYSTDPYATSQGIGIFLGTGQICDVNFTIPNAGPAFDPPSVTGANDYGIISSSAVSISFNTTRNPALAHVTQVSFTATSFFRNWTKVIQNPDGSWDYSQTNDYGFLNVSANGGNSVTIPSANRAQVSLTANPGQTIRGVTISISPANPGQDNPYGSLTMDNITILTAPVQFDLSVSGYSITQNGQVVHPDGSGVLNLVAGVPATMGVQVAGTNILTGDTRSTSLVFSVNGSTIHSIPIRLSSIQQAGGVLNLSVPFTPTGSGLQTWSATVDADNSLNESSLSNNTSAVQVKIVAPYKLTAKVQNADGTWQDVPDAGGVFAAVPSDFIFNTKLDAFALGGAVPSQPQKLQLGCVDPSTFPPTPVSGCQFQIQPLTLGNSDPYSNGGHTHADHRQFILGDTESLFAYDGATHSVDVTGQSLTYWPPIIAGDVLVKINGFDNRGNPIQAAPPITFRVNAPGLQQLTADTYRLKCTLAPNDPGCPSGGYQHTNFYNVTSAVNASMSKIGSDYSDAVPNDPSLVITDASLAWGGLYDFANSWAPSHKYHRQGTDIDVRRSTISDEEEFKIAVCDNGGYPLPEDSLHYHLFFYSYAGSKSLIALCK